jgi:putative sterol carrier protein
MSTFDSAAQAERVFTSLFNILLEDDRFVSRVRQSNLSLQLIHTDPDVNLYVDAESGVRTGQQLPASIRIKMSSDTAHRLWMGKLMMPVALATGKVRVKGSVARVMEFVPLLQPAFDRYPAIAAAEGLVASAQ